MAEDEPYRDQTELAWAAPEILQSMGGWLHANNVLFYFAESPFFDKSSENFALFIQYVGQYGSDDILGTRQKFENNLRKRQGLSYVVVHDPLQPAKMVEAPDGTRHPANVWVIRKQFRPVAGEDTNLETLAYYYISGIAVYEAPTLAQVLNNRMLNVTDAIGQMLDEASKWSLFSTAHGHTYAKPTIKPITQKEPTVAQQSKESTPMPGQEGPEVAHLNVTGELELSTKSEKDVESRTLLQALQMTLRYGKEYSDDTPLTGEPGKFRITTISKGDHVAKQTNGLAGSSQPSGSRAGTPAMSRGGSSMPGTK